MDASTSFRKLIPEAFGPFSLLREIGSGGHGVVFLAERTKPFTQKAAVKVFFTGLRADRDAITDSSAINPLSELKHPGIVGLLDSGVTESGLRYLVMEYVEGAVLDEYCDDARLSTAKRVEILCAILGALEYAHRRLIIHADLKPDNIRVNPEGRPRLLDFGTARLAAERGPGHAGDERAGPPFAANEQTPLFASPEQLRGERLTISSDIYSMGLIVRLVLCGLRPDPSDIQFSDKGASAGTHVPATRMLEGQKRGTLEEIASRRGATAKSFCESLGPDMDAIIERALRFKPADRYQSAAEMRDELERFRLGYPLRTRPLSRLGRADKWVRRNRLAATFATVLLVAALFSVAGIGWRTAEARQRRVIAQDRLHELVRLTDALAGELIGSLQGLDGSEAARDALLKSAHETIRTLAVEKGDPQLQLELVSEFQKLAKLELARTPGNAAAGQIAQDDIRRASKLLDELNQNDQEVVQLRRESVAISRSIGSSGVAPDTSVH